VGLIQLESSLKLVDALVGLITRAAWVTTMKAINKILKFDGVQGLLYPDLPFECSFCCTMCTHDWPGRKGLVARLYHP